MHRTADALIPTAFVVVSWRCVTKRSCNREQRSGTPRCRSKIEPTKANRCSTSPQSRATLPAESEAILGHWFNPIGGRSLALAI